MDEVLHPFTGKVVFASHELANSPDDPEQDGFYDEATLVQLGFLRAAMRRPMKINSGPRSLKHNKAIGGKDDSMHLYEGPGHEEGCVALDISTAGWSEEEVERLVTLAWSYGWSVGVANSFVHIDCRSLVYGRRQAWWFYNGYRPRLRVNGFR